MSIFSPRPSGWPLAALTLVVASVCNAALSREDRVVVVSHPGAIEQVSTKDLYRLFSGKSMGRSGAQLVAVVNEGDDELLTLFARAFLQRNAGQLRSQWARLLFTGKGRLPTMVSNGAETRELVASDPRYIGFIWASEVDDTVEVIALEDWT